MKGKTNPFLERSPFSQSGYLLLEDGTIYVCYSRIRMGGLAKVCGLRFVIGVL